MCITIEELNETLVNIKDVIISSLKEELNNLKSQVNVLEGENNQRIKEVAELKQQNNNLKEMIISQTDRSMRNNLVIRGMKREIKESWEDTEKAVINLITRHLKIEQGSTKGMIQRAHRGSGTDRETIYANFYSWKDCQYVLDGFTKARINNREMMIKVDQMYSKETMARRNEALKERRKLLDFKDLGVVKAHVAYPAKLMKKLKNEQKYILHKEF